MKMRKKIICLFAFLFTLSLIVGCSPQSEPAPPVNGGASANSTTLTDPTSTGTTTSPSANNPDAFSLFSKPWAQLDAKTQKVLKACGLTRDVVEGDKRKLTYSPEHSATDLSPLYKSYERQGVIYSFNDPNGNLTYLNLPLVEEGQVKTEAELRTIAYTIIDLFIDRSAYQEDASLSDTGVYYWYFSRVVHGYETLDSVCVSLSKTGYVRLITVTKRNTLDGVKAPTTNEEQVERFCTDFLKTLYPETEGCEIQKKLLDKKDGQMLAYYKRQLSLPDGQVSILCHCRPIIDGEPWGRLIWVAVPANT